MNYLWTFLLIAALVLSGFSLGVAYTSYKETEVAPLPEEEIEEPEITAPVDYRFTISPPENWGALTEYINVGETSVITWISASDPDRYLTIRVIPTLLRNEPANVDRPQTLLAENADYGFYYSAGGSDRADLDPKFSEIKKEVEEAIQTFSIL